MRRRMTGAVGLSLISSLLAISCSDSDTKNPDLVVVADAPQKKDMTIVDQPSAKEVGPKDSATDGPVDCSVRCVTVDGWDYGRPYCSVLGKGDGSSQIYAWFDGCSHKVIYDPLAPDMAVLCAKLTCCAICQEKRGYKGWFDTCSGELVGEEDIFCDKVK